MASRFVGDSITYSHAVIIATKNFIVSYWAVALFSFVTICTDMHLHPVSLLSEQSS